MELEQFYSDLEERLAALPTGEPPAPQDPRFDARYTHVACTIWYPKKAPRWDSATMNCLYYQLEKGANSDESKGSGYHIQLYCWLKKRTRVSTVCQLLGVQFNQCWFEQCKSPKDYAEYCSDHSKDTFIFGPLKMGMPPKKGQGRRTDVEEVIQAVERGSTYTQIADEFPAQFLRMHKGLKELIMTKKGLRAPPPNRRDKMEVLYIWGETGCGKTFFVEELVGDKGAWISDNQWGWFQPYEGEETVVFDEFEGKFPRNQMLQLLDGQRSTQAQKGSFVAVLATLVIFTSNFPPEHHYSGAPEWKRRLKHVYCFPDDEPKAREDCKMPPRAAPTQEEDWPEELQE